MGCPGSCLPSGNATRALDPPTHKAKGHALFVAGPMLSPRLPMHRDGAMERDGRGTDKNVAHSLPGPSRDGPGRICMKFGQNIKPATFQV